MIPSLRCRLALAFALPFQAAAQLPLKQDDTVCLIGNALADRMQHDGWVETLLQSAAAGKNLSIRNLGVSGDTVTSRPRSKGVPSPEDYLATCTSPKQVCVARQNANFIIASIGDQ